MRIGILGAGYVGLVTAACLAELDHDVSCMDSDETKIARLRSGQLPIFEPGLVEIVARNVRQNRLRFTCEIDELAARGIDVLFIAVGTPDNDSGGASLDFVFAAAEQAARALRSSRAHSDFAVFVTKSTVPVGTSRTITAIVGEHLPADAFAVASNPEFLREGSAIKDFMEPDRIVVGSHSEHARKVLEELYLPLIRKGRPLVVTSAVETAELIKYAANAFLATKVAFINELARLCEATGADVRELALGVGLDGRIGSEFMKPGPGFGGSCFPKDLKALIKTASDFGSPVEIAETVLRANDHHKHLMVAKIRRAVGGSLSGMRLGILGLTFKANTDDMRDAPALAILPRLVAEGAVVSAFDPIAPAATQRMLPAVRHVNSVDQVFRDADAVILLTEWEVFRSLPWAALAETMRRRVLVDLRNLCDPVEMSNSGLTCIPLGRREVKVQAKGVAA